MNDDLEKSEAQQIALRHKAASETAEASRAEQQRAEPPRAEPHRAEQQRTRPGLKVGAILLAVFGVGLLVFVAAPALIALFLFLVYGFVPGR